MEKITKASLYESSNFFSRLYCSWVIPYYQLYNSRSKIEKGKSSDGSSKLIEIGDIHRCSKDDESKSLYSKFERNYQDCLNRDINPVTPTTDSNNFPNLSQNGSLINKSPSLKSNGANGKCPPSRPPSLITTTTNISSIISICKFLLSFILFPLSSFHTISSLPTFRTSPFRTALIQTFSPELLYSFVLVFIQDCLVKPVQPILIGLIIGYFNSLSSSDEKTSSTSTELSPAVLSAVALCGSSFLVVALHHPSLTLAMRLSMRVKIIWSSMIYHKCLKMSTTTTTISNDSSSKDGATSRPVVSTNLSQIINLLTNDIRRFDEFAIMCHHLVIVPIQTVLILLVAWHYIGPVCLATFGAFILLAYLLSRLGKWLADLRTRSIIFTEHRLKILQEMFRYLRAIKIYTLESRFLARIYEARRTEVNNLRLPLTIRSATLSFSMVSGRVIMYFSFLLYLLFLDSNEKFRPETIFVSVALFERLRYSLTWTLPQAISGLYDFLSSCNRIEQFLQIPDKSISSQEIDPSGTWVPNNKSSNGSKGIWISNLYSQYSSVQKSSDPEMIQNKPFQLQDINIRVESGQVLSIIGPVGSGKSTLLLTILQELSIEKSTQFSISGTIAYVSQELYCLNDSIRENIVFGAEYDEERYRSVIDVCALGPDMEQFSAGDMTLVGESGFTLSGGQKARINLARALYSDRDIYLLDDPFSAVDAQLARHIYDRCIQKFLRNKSILIATHQLQFVPKSHRILLLDSGRPVAYGQFDQLLRDNPKFSNYFHHLSSSSFEVSDVKLPRTRRLSSEESQSCSEVILEDECPLLESKLLEQEPTNNCDNRNHNGDNNDQVQLLLNQNSNRNSNNMIITQYINYFRLGSNGAGSFSLVILTAILPQLLVYYCDYWLTQWNQSTTTFGTGTFLLIYTCIVVSIVVSSILRSYTFYQMCFNASERIHNRTIRRICEASVSHFDYIPIGKLLNYFTRDVGILDELLPSTLFELNLAFSQVASIVAVILFLNPYMTGITVIYLVILYHSRQYFANLSNLFRSFELKARNQIFAHLSSTINGLVTIRAYSMEPLYLERFHRHLDQHTATNFLQYCSTRLFCLGIDLLAVGYIALVLTLLFYCSINSPTNGDNSNIGPLVGVCLGSIFNLIGIAQWATKRTIDSDQWISSFTNLQLFDCLPKEQELEGGTVRGDDQADGNEKVRYEIYCTNLSVYYQQHLEQRKKSLNFEFVLKNVDLRIPFGEKIGICGRSGAGKSTLANTLLRLTDYRGLIELNGTELHSFPLADLRRRISIIPQYPVIFSATIRSNLDLFERFTENQLWMVLERVQLRSMIESLEHRLDEEISLDSPLFSVGQKQLICLARIMLHDSWLIILDEATANVDYHTDQLIQNTIREVFRDCTVITIAHRLDSIIDCDRILVFNDGQLIEDDSPGRLLSNKSGHFSQLVKQTGSKMAARLQSIVDSNSDSKSNLKFRAHSNILKN